MSRILDENKYFDYRIIPGRGIVGLMRFVFTIGLVYGIDEDFYEGRYCFHTLADAREALNSWDGVGDPPGQWIKHKGRIEYRNPDYIED